MALFKTCSDKNGAVFKLTYVFDNGYFVEVFIPGIKQNLFVLIKSVYSYFMLAFFLLFLKFSLH